jgi:thymidylate synthase
MQLPTSQHLTNTIKSTAMNKFEDNYKSLLQSVIHGGEQLPTRNGNTMAQINMSLRANRYDPPIITGKKVFYDKAVAEWIWMLEGRTDIDFLHQHNIKWWDDYAEDGHVAKSYGYQLRTNPDQIEYVLSELRKPYTSRRARISLWQPRDLEEQKIPCCYTEFDFIKRGGALQMVMTFRSSDLFLGFPYDALVGYLLLKYIANQLGLEVFNIIYHFINVHVYNEHREAVLEYVEGEHYNTSLIINDAAAVDGVEIKMDGQGPYIKAKLIL